jgi:opacity protein-like surface antigen
VPFLTAGLGFSLNDVNDSSKPRIKIKGDDSTIAGTLTAGFDYFLVPNVAVGGSVHSWIYPDMDTSVIIRDDFNRVIFTDESKMNLTSVALLVHIRLFPGQAASADGSRSRRLFLADHGPFDTEERRYYLYGTAGNMIFLDDDFGGGISLQSPGGVNWLLGGGLGVNLGRRWGLEVQLVNSDPNMKTGAIGKFAEMSNFVVLPQVRYRWQFLDGRLVPFVMAGIGVTFNDINDRRSVVDVYPSDVERTPLVDVDGSSVVGSVGVGIEYFLNHNLSFGLAVPFYFYPDWDTSVQQRGPNGGLIGSPVESTMNYSGPAPMARLTAYIP